jgi:hypothetical protein
MGRRHYLLGGSFVAAFIACTGTGTFNVSGTFNFSLQAFQVDDPCGDFPVTQQTNCHYQEGGTTCATACDQVRYEASCADQSYTECNNVCVAEPKQECSTQCGTQCIQECQTRPAETICGLQCENRCSTSCGAQCSASADSVGCSWRCKATCENSCETKCQTIPASATCDQKCGVACSTSCRTVENMRCFDQCETKTYQVCQPKLVEECRTKCTQNQGIMVCDQQFVDAQDPRQCQQYIENTFRLKVRIGGVVL